MQWSQAEPAQDPNGVGIADGGCKLAARRDGAIGTFYLPMTLVPGHYRYEFELTSVSCRGREPRTQPQTARQTIAFDVP